MVVIEVTLATLARHLPRLLSDPIVIEHGQRLRRDCSCQLDSILNHRDLLLVHVVAIP